MTDDTQGPRLLRIAQLSAELNKLCHSAAAPRARCISLLAELLDLLHAEDAYERGHTMAIPPDSPFQQRH